MAKVSAALGRYDQAGGLYISVLTNPTMGGVAASFALQGDITLAEPGALVGFAGKRTIWNTVRLELPEGFQTSEFLLRHGFIDRIIHRKDLRTEVSRIIDYCEHRPIETTARIESWDCSASYLASARERRKSRSLTSPSASTCAALPARAACRKCGTPTTATWAERSVSSCSTKKRPRTSRCASRA